MTTKTIGATTGTVTTTTGSAAVVGSSSTFSLAYIGGAIIIAGITCTVLSVTDATHLTLTGTYGSFGGTGGSGQAYSRGTRDFATLAAYASYLSTLSISAPEVGNFYNDGQFVPAAASTIGGWTGGSGTNTLTMTAAPGEGFADATPQTHALTYNQFNGVGITTGGLSYTTVCSVTTGNFIMTRLQFKANAASCKMVTTTQFSNTNINANIFFGPMPTASGNGGVECPLQSTQNWENNLVITTNAGGRAMYINNTGGSGSGTLTGNTFICSTTPGGANNGIEVTVNLGLIAKNNVVYGFLTDYAGVVSGSSSNNATSKGSFGGVNWGGSGVVSVPSSAFGNVSSGTEDARLVTGSALLNVGATAGSGVDIVGTTRPQGAAYDIGCWELVVGGVTTKPYPFMMRAA